MIKLRDLLREDDIVKNKKTGNIYMVKQMDPAKHDKPTPAEVEKTKAANNGQIPKGEKPSKPAPRFEIISVKNDWVASLKKSTTPSGYSPLKMRTRFSTDALFAASTSRSAKLLSAGPSMTTPAA